MDQEAWDRQQLQVIVALKKKALVDFVCLHKRPAPGFGRSPNLATYSTLAVPPDTFRQMPLGSFCTICKLPDWTVARVFLLSKKEGGPYYACSECRRWYVVKAELGQFPVTVRLCRACGGGVVPRALAKRIKLARSESQVS